MNVLWQEVDWKLEKIDIKITYMRSYEDYIVKSPQIIKHERIYL